MAFQLSRPGPHTLLRRELPMRHYETTVQKLKDEVLTAVARLAWNERLQTNDLLNIPEEIIPGPEAQMRCCIYKERAVVTSRIKMAMGGEIGRAHV